ncbi:hypothetical protein [Azohydromonas lata]|uniref:VCBS repeat-containing protein n=1 Tax=Azohydromonas lata TaxID=45677 RepID=A0ABU5IF82_9BURK|nr:hypothetical protein [Azohydromonas lata]MDZ5457783.1 hypothetical protein [Azohydromonas lata]
MKIASSSLQMASMHAESRQTDVKETMQAWNGNRRSTLNLEGHYASAGVGVAASSVEISEAGRRAAAQAEARASLREAALSASASESTAPASGTSATEGTSEEDEDNLPPRLKLIKSVVEKVLGEFIRLANARPLEAAQTAQTAQAGQAARRLDNATAVGMSYDKTVTHTESEQMHFEAQGVVKTADGQEISFQVALDMQRSYSSSESTHFQVGQAPKDPLVITYPGQVPELTDTKFDFDLDGDGNKEKISFVKSGSGFLVFDKNNDNKANDGKELFGTKTGNGFAELAELDVDKNGWVDENDPAFSQLKLWTKDEAGKDHLQGLLAANIGAISTQSTAAPFKFKDANNVEQGVMRQAGVYLQEDGKGAGTVGQVDLMV